MKTGCRYKAENYRKKRVGKPPKEGAALRFQGVSVRVRCQFSLSSLPYFVSPALSGGDSISALLCLWFLTADRSVVGGWGGSRAFLPLPLQPPRAASAPPSRVTVLQGGPASDQWVPGL